jgi:predicted DCC family thiol-disulfide oxidoreductase YuxK
VIALYCSCEQAEKAKTQAREAVVLLEQARMLLSEENAVQLAMQHTDEAIREADRRAAMLEDWYRRTYSSSADSAAHQSGKYSGSGRNTPGCS